MDRKDKYPEKTYSKKEVRELVIKAYYAGYHTENFSSDDGLNEFLEKHKLD